METNETPVLLTLSKREFELVIHGLRDLIIDFQGNGVRTNEVGALLAKLEPCDPGTRIGPPGPP